MLTFLEAVPFLEVDTDVVEGDPGDGEQDANRFGPTFGIEVVKSVLVVLLIGHDCIRPKE